MATVGVGAEERWGSTEEEQDNLSRSNKKVQMATGVSSQGGMPFREEDTNETRRKCSYIDSVLRKCLDSMMKGAEDEEEKNISKADTIVEVDQWPLFLNKGVESRGHETFENLA